MPADTYFTALAKLVADCLEHEAPLRLPVSSDPLTQQVIAYTDDHLSTVTVAALCRVVGFQSISAFSRGFVHMTGETPTSYRSRVRAVPI